ncbi:high-affinity Zn(2+) transporter zrt1 [Podila horticola]|nr:high-affinity Zn(2+) transporter zrt1 [Podila horticola]
MSDANSTEPMAPEDYNLGLHIGGLFANMAASGLGVLLPILFSLTSFSPKTTSKIQSVIQTARTFGSGVILATAFIHMLPSAFANLSDPSLPWQFQEKSGYTGWAGLIAMLAALLLHLLEFTATQRFFLREKERLQFNTSSGLKGHVSDIGGPEKNKSGSDSDSLYGNEATQGHAVTISGLQEPDPCVHVGHVHGGEILLANKKTPVSASSNQVEAGHHHMLDDEEEARVQDQENQSRMIGTFILEFGIALHSVIIGITLGTTVGTEFVSLLIALLFHQFFEGVALGGRIASLNTPVGVALGIGIRQSYDGTSVTALLVQGVFDSLSAGILLYTAMVQLMSTELNSNRAFRESSTRSQTVQFVALWCGAAAMAIVGKWA